MSDLITHVKTSIPNLREGAIILEGKSTEFLQITQKFYTDYPLEVTSLVMEKTVIGVFEKRASVDISKNTALKLAHAIINYFEE